MKRIIELRNKKKKIKLQVKVCNSLQKISGLIFNRKEKARALLFEFKNSSPPIHSFFVFFPFYAIWLDDKNKIREIKKIKPFTFHVKPKKSYSKLIEIPINKRYKELVKILES